MAEADRVSFNTTVDWRVALDSKTREARHAVSVTLHNLQSVQQRAAKQKIVLKLPRERNCGPFKTTGDGQEFPLDYGFDPDLHRYAIRLSDLARAGLEGDPVCIRVEFPERGALETGISEKQYDFGFGSSFKSRGTRLEVILPEVRPWPLRWLVQMSALLDGKDCNLYDGVVHHRSQTGMTGWEDPPDMRSGKFCCNTKEVLPGSRVVFKRISINPLHMVGALIGRIGALFKLLGGGP